MKKFVVLGIVVVLVIVGLVGYSFFKPPKEASGPIEAVPIGLGEDAQPTDAPRPEPTAEISPTATAEVVAPEAPASTDEPAATATSTPEATESTDPTATAAAPVIFEIVQADSEARFIIDEVLNGAPKTVVGATDQVAGEIAIYVDAPADSKIGTILVNARTLTTDNEFRNRALKNRILFTDDYEFVTFVPTQVVGLPNSVSVGESFDFQIVGDLTVRDVTHSVSFDTTVTPVSETQIEGIASTTILYADFGLVIPNAPAVASVEDEVILEIEFVAVAE